MNFWRELWEEIRYGLGGQPKPEWTYTPITSDPDYQERQRLQKEKRRLLLKHELMQLTEDIDNLRDACEKMQARHTEFEQRHQPTPESRQK
jgi:hypothetical protein